VTRSEQTQEIQCACGNRALILCINCQAELCDRCYDLGEGYCDDCRDAPQPRRSWYSQGQQSPLMIN
jgi:hypothetical protein